MSSDEELKHALANKKENMLSVHVKITKLMEKGEGKCQTKKKVQLPRQYFDNLLLAKQNLSRQGTVVIHDQNFEKTRKMIRKHPGVLFVGGEWNQNVNGEKKRSVKNRGPRKMLARKNGENKTKCYQNLKVNRIIRPKKAISLLRSTTKNENDKEEIKLYFL